MDNKSTLNRSETIERLGEISDMSDEEIKINQNYIRITAISAHNHILHLRSELDKVKRRLKAKPKSDPIPLPTIKPGDKVIITDAMDHSYIGKVDIVTSISGSAPYSARLKDSLGDWPFSSLEVSHD
ncbi:hypothetical protein D3C74_301030 [compost metagenome]